MLPIIRVPEILRYFAEGKSCDEVLEVLMPVRHEAQGRNERTAKASSSMSLYRQAMSRWVVAMKGDASSL